MKSETPKPKSSVGHPRLLRCSMENPAGNTSIRYVELEQFRLWAYMMESRHGIIVDDVQLSLWVTPEEFRDKFDLFIHSGQVEDVSRIAIGWFNPHHHYTLETTRYVPTKHYKTVKRILLSHIPESNKQSRMLSVDEHHGVCINQVIEDPGVELILGLSDVGFGPRAAATP